MKIKKFTAADTNKALRQVRLELGDDAVILSNKRTESGIEIISATDFDDGLYQSIRAEVRQRTEESTEVSSHRANDNPSEIQELKSDLSDLRGMLTAELGRARGLSQPHRDLDSAGRFVKLVQLGFAEAQALKIAESIHIEAGDQLDKASLSVCLSELLLKPSPVQTANGGMLAFVGPTGVGKTTSIAKLAAQIYLRDGANSVALISADSRRIGAHQQLSRVAGLLGIPMFEANSNSELSACIDMAGDARWILIDTAGLGLADPALDSTLHTLRELPHSIELVLTIAANAQASCLRWVLARYQHYAPDAIALTKTDECTHLAPAIGCLLENSSALAFVADGQAIPDDLHIAAQRMDWLAQTILEPVNYQSTPFNPGAMMSQESTHVPS